MQVQHVVKKANGMLALIVRGFKYRSRMSGYNYRTSSGKCTQLQLLTDRIRELELELDELWIIQEAKVVIERTYKEVVTPK
eukprot:g29522.t1